jgi:hypothetical protein
MTGKAMKTTLASLFVAAALLSAGAFAGIDARHQAVNGRQTNVTEIAKNAAWPVIGQITTESCKVNKCFDI